MEDCHMSKQENVAAQERLAEGINSGDMDVMDDVFASNVLDHDPAPNQGPGPEGYKQFFTTLRSAFPDLQITPDRLIADEENVVVAYTLSGTHRGSFQGVLATGKHVSVRGMQIGRFEAGKIVERWGTTDELGILRQLGVDPTASQSTGAHQV